MPEPQTKVIDGLLLKSGQGFGQTTGKAIVLRLTMPFGISM